MLTVLYNIWRTARGIILGDVTTVSLVFNLVQEMVIKIDHGKKLFMKGVRPILCPYFGQENTRGIIPVAVNSYYLQ